MNQLSDKCYLQLIVLDIRYYDKAAISAISELISNFKSAIKKFANVITCLHANFHIGLVCLHNKVEVLVKPSKLELVAFHKAVDSIKLSQLKNGQHKMGVDAATRSLQQISDFISKHKAKFQEIFASFFFCFYPKLTIPFREVVTNLGCKISGLEFVYVSLFFIPSNSNSNSAESVGNQLLYFSTFIDKVKGAHFKALQPNTLDWEVYFYKSIAQRFIPSIKLTIELPNSSIPIYASPYISTAVSIAISHHQIEKQTSGPPTCFKIGNCYLPLLPNLQFTNTIELVFKLNLRSLDEALFYGMAYKLQSQSKAEELTAMALQLESNQWGLLARSTFNFSSNRDTYLQNYYVLFPTNNGCLLLRSIASKEQVLAHTTAATQSDFTCAPSKRAQAFAFDELNKLNCTDYNPMQFSSFFHTNVSTLVDQANVDLEQMDLTEIPDSIDLSQHKRSQTAGTTNSSSNTTKATPRRFFVSTTSRILKKKV